MPPERGQFDALRERLLAGGIAPRRVKRYLAELDDHLAELTLREQAAGYGGEDANIRARALLGSDDELAQSWLSDPRLRSFTARAPWLVFGILPPFALIAGFVIPLLLVVVCAHVIGFLPVHARLGALPTWLRQSIHILPMILNLAVGPLLLVCLSSIAWRQRLNLVWPALACGVLLLFFIRLDINIPQDRPSQIAITSLPLTLLIGHPDNAFSIAAPWQFAAQFVFTIVPLAWLVRLHRKSAASE